MSKANQPKTLTFVTVRSIFTQQKVSKNDVSTQFSYFFQLVILRWKIDMFGSVFATVHPAARWHSITCCQVPTFKCFVSESRPKSSRSKWHGSMFGPKNPVNHCVLLMYHAFYCIKNRPSPAKADLAVPPEIFTPFAPTGAADLC